MRVYIAGPIAGYEDANRAAFTWATRHLQDAGHDPVNPHNIAPRAHDGDCPPGLPGGEGAEHTAPCYMRTDLAAMLTCDALWLLEGWQESSGARVEKYLAAHVCGIPILNASTTCTPKPTASTREAFDLEDFTFGAEIDCARAWSEDTFGPGARTEGVLDHIRKELVEVAEAVAAGDDPLPEWADVIIIGIDGAGRAGATGHQVIDAIRSKWARNRGRVWPDWRNAAPGKAIEHIRTGER